MPTCRRISKSIRVDKVGQLYGCKLQPQCLKMAEDMFSKDLVGSLLFMYIFGALALAENGVPVFNSTGSSIMLESPAPAEVPPGEGTWYGNIQYLLNISAIGALCCLLLFLCVKLRSDHKLPGLSSLATKLLAVWHTTGQQIARTCGANPAQFLYVEGGTFVALAVICFLAICGILPLNLYGGTVPMEDQFSKTTISHILKGSPLLWIHVLFMLIVVYVVHFCIKALEERLNLTRFHDGNFSIDSVSVYTLMIQGIPKTLSIDKRAIQEYFEHRYPGKVYRVVVPPDLACLDDLAQELVKVRNDITWLQARIDSRDISEERDIFLYFYEQDAAANLSVEERHHGSWYARLKYEWKLLIAKLKRFKEWAAFHLGFTDEERLRRLEAHREELECRLAVFKDGRAEGAGVAFVIFKDIYTANKALQDARTEKKRPRIGKFVSIMELQLEKSRWKVERAPPAADIYWRHLGTSKFSRKIRRVIVNASLLVLLLFFSSPLAIITALQSAGRIIDAEAMDNAASWLAWVQSSSWAAALFFQFLPNVLIFVSMYIVIPAALSSLSKIESHLTVSGEHQAVLVKTFCFFLVNLIFLRVLVESSLESALLRMGQCYMDGNDCKKIEQYMSASFLTRSCLSSLAFLITCTFLGISFDLLAPIPWIKKKLQKFGNNGLLQSTREETEVYANESREDNLDSSLLSESYFSLDDVDTVLTQREGVNGLDLQGGDLSVYPISRKDHHPMIQTFDFAQYYAFNLTIFALTLIYSAFAPLVLPVGACYFGYRYVVDKYNFLFVYRVHGLPAGNDGKLMTTVLRIMRLCVILFLLSMLFFFSVRGDSGKLQFLCTFVTIIFYCFKCGFDKLISSTRNGFPPDILEGVRIIDSIVDGPTEYEVYAQPNYDWDVSSI